MGTSGNFRFCCAGHFSGIVGNSPALTLRLTLRALCFLVSSSILVVASFWQLRTSHAMLLNLSPAANRRFSRLDYHHYKPRYVITINNYEPLKVFLHKHHETHKPIYWVRCSLMTLFISLLVTFFSPLVIYSPPAPRP